MEEPSCSGVWALVRPGAPKIAAAIVAATAQTMRAFGWPGNPMALQSLAKELQFIKEPTEGGLSGADNESQTRKVTHLPRFDEGSSVWRRSRTAEERIRALQGEKRALADSALLGAEKAAAPSREDLLGPLE